MSMNDDQNLMKTTEDQSQCQYWPTLYPPHYKDTMVLLQGHIVVDLSQHTDLIIYVIIHKHIYKATSFIKMLGQLL